MARLVAFTEYASYSGARSIKGRAILETVA